MNDKLQYIIYTVLIIIGALLMCEHAIIWQELEFLNDIVGHDNIGLVAIIIGTLGMISKAQKFKGWDYALNRAKEEIKEMYKRFKEEINEND